MVQMGLSDEEVGWGQASAAVTKEGVMVGIDFNEASVGFVQNWQQAGDFAAIRESERICH